MDERSAVELKSGETVHQSVPGLRRPNLQRRLAESQRLVHLFWRFVRSPAQRGYDLSLKLGGVRGRALL
jgi:hypothetical protein